MPGCTAVSMAGQDWTPREVELIVSDYFEMLRLELLGLPYNKRQHNRQLCDQLEGRSHRSVEMKHANVSSVLCSLGLPFIFGYKPLDRIQKNLLPQAVAAYLEAHPSFFVETADQADAEEQKLEPLDLSQVHLDRVFTHAPPPLPSLPPGLLDCLERRPRVGKVDYALRDVRNRRLGAQGERFTLEIERRRLLALRRDDLAKKVELVSETQGDGCGFDLLSFDELTDEERWIEIKTTSLGIRTPFYISANEVRCSEENAERYQVYRLYDFYRGPRIYRLSGSVRQSCQLEAVQWRAAVV